MQETYPDFATVDAFFKKYFKGATQWGLIDYSYSQKTGWLEVLYKGKQDAEGKHGRFVLLAAQSIGEYCTLIDEPQTAEPTIVLHDTLLLDRIIARLFEVCRSLSQDIECLYEDARNARKV